MGNRHRPGRHSHARVVRHMEVDHLTDVHAVDVIRTKNDDQMRIMLFDKIQVLENRIGSALEPLGPIRICGGTTVTN